MIAQLLMQIGVRGYDIKWVGDDLATVYAEWPNPWSFVQLLSGLGYDWFTIKSTLDSIVGDSETLQRVLMPEFRFAERHPNQLYNATIVLCRYVPQNDILDVFRAQYPLPEIAERIADYMERMV